MFECIVNVNGYEVVAKYHQEDIDGIFIPLLDTLQKLQKNKKKRIFVFLAGPAGCGKSTLGLFLQKLANEKGISMQCVGLDGFHYPNSYLQVNDLMSIKGHPKTFDVSKLKEKLIKSSSNSCYWPIYSRKLHDPIEDGVFVNSDIILVEGNYLLLDTWCDLQPFCDYSIFISCNPEIVKERLIQRKCKGGYTFEKACEHYEFSDKKNVEIILEESMCSDLCLKYDGDKYIIL